MQRNHDLSEQLEATIKRELSFLRGIKKDTVANQKRATLVKKSKSNPVATNKAVAETTKALAPLSKPYFLRPETTKVLAALPKPSELRKDNKFIHKKLSKPPKKLKPLTTSHKPASDLKTKTSVLVSERKLEMTVAQPTAAAIPVKSHAENLKKAAFKGSAVPAERHTFQVIRVDGSEEIITYSKFGKDVQAQLKNIKKIIFNEPFSIDQLRYIVNFLKFHCSSLKSIEILGTVYRPASSPFTASTSELMFAQEISHLLTSPFSLEELFIEEHNFDAKKTPVSINDPGCAIIGAALVKNQSLRKFTLGLKQVDYSEKGYETLMEAIILNERLKNFPKYDSDGKAMTAEGIKDWIAYRELEKGIARSISAPNKSKKQDPINISLKNKFSLFAISNDSGFTKPKVVGTAADHPVDDKLKQSMALDRI